MKKNQTSYTEILVGIRKIIRVIDLESKQVDKQYGVSIPQLLCMNFLSQKEAYTSNAKDIKDFLNLNASTVTGIVNRLEKKGMLEKLPKIGDKRVSRIQLSKKGLDLVESLPQLMHERIVDQLKKLSNNKISELKSAINLLTNIMGADDIDASPLITIQVP